MDCKIGDILLLRDKETLAQQMDKEHHMTGVQATIRRSQKFAANCGSTTVSFHIIEFTDSNLVVIEKTVRSAKESPIDVKGVYFVPDGLTGGSRKDWVDSGREWIFDEPKGPFNPNNPDNLKGLEYQPVIKKEGCPDYERQGDSFGGTHMGETWLITEWLCTGPTDNPRILILETGDYLRFFLGCEVMDSDIEIYKKDGELCSR